MKKKKKKGGASKKAKEEAKEETKEEPKEDAPAETPAEAADEAPAEDAEDEKAIADDKADDASPPSLALQSKLRSTSFRAGASPGSPGPLSPDGGGDTAPDIYRKHVARIEELEQENKKLLKDSEDAEKRWKKSEDELADLREAEADGSKGDDDTEKLVCLVQLVHNFRANFCAEERNCISTATEHATTITSF